ALLFSPNARAQINDKATSNVAVRAQGPAMEAHILNRNFLFDSRLHWGADAPTRLLMRLDVETIQRDDTEGLMRSDVTATVWRLDTAGKQIWLWSTTEPGDLGEIEHDQPAVHRSPARLLRGAQHVLRLRPRYGPAALHRHGRTRFRVLGNA